MSSGLVGQVVQPGARVGCLLWKQDSVFDPEGDPRGEPNVAAIEQPPPTPPHALPHSPPSLKLALNVTPRLCEAHSRRERGERERRAVLPRDPKNAGNRENRDDHRVAGCSWQKCGSMPSNLKPEVRKLRRELCLYQR